MRFPAFAMIILRFVGNPGKEGPSRRTIPTRKHTSVVTDRRSRGRPLFSINLIINHIATGAISGAPVTDTRFVADD